MLGGVAFLYVDFDPSTSRPAKISRRPPPVVVPPPPVRYGDSGVCFLFLDLLFIVGRISDFDLVMHMHSHSVRNLPFVPTSKWYICISKWDCRLIYAVAISIYIVVRYCNCS